MPRPSALSPESTEIVDGVIAALSIPANAPFYDQESWAALAPVREGEVTACNTRCCIGGWMVYVKSKKVFAEIVNAALQKSSKIYAMDAAARKLMTLVDGSPAFCDNLFMGSPARSWGQEYEQRWAACQTPQEFAAVAVSRLKDFRATGR